MDIRSSLIYQINDLSRNQRGGADQAARQGLVPKPKNSNPLIFSADLVRISNDRTALETTRSGTITQKGTRLVAEDQTNTENGKRRTQRFENEKGEGFLRIEDITQSDNRIRRLVIQQNDSGSSLVSETIYDRQSNGSFRATQRLTDESGEIQTHITYDLSAAQTGFFSSNPATVDGLKPENSTRGVTVNLVV